MPLYRAVPVFWIVVAILFPLNLSAQSNERVVGSTVDKARELSQLTGRPILAIAGSNS